ncbi:penicillin-binding protein 2 [Caldicellulosiruptoraceae bacterium PP1]
MKFISLNILKEKRFTRNHFIIILLIFANIVLITRLFFLQIIKGDYYLEASEKKIMQKISVEAPRGGIYDRYGTVLADNRPAYVVQIVKTTELNKESYRKDFTKRLIEVIKILNRNNEKIFNSFKIDLNPTKFDFGISDKNLSKRVEKQWKKDRLIDEKATASEAYEILKNRFYISNNIDKNLEYQLVSIEDKIFYEYFQLYQPVTISIDVSQKTVAQLEENKSKFPFINIDIIPIRVYKDALANAHIIGRIGKISQEQYESLKDKGYSNDSIIGIEGIEKTFEQYLKGKDGVQYIEVEKNGIVNNSLKSIYPVKGSNVYLTIDEELQKATYNSLENVIKNIRSGKYGETFSKATSGAAVVLDIKSGDVLALASYPSYDSNLFIKGIKKDDWDSLINNKDRPMFNRAIAGAYPPGSTFKILSAIAGLQEGVIKPDEKILDTGRYMYYASSGFTPACWLWNRYRQTHGWVNVSDALKVSCNVFFYETGRRLGINRIEKYARLFGLGEKTNVQLDNESSGIIANDQNKRKIFNQPWYPGDTVLAAIGQSINSFTPIQMASFIATVANGGTRYQVNLVKEIINSEGKTVYKANKKIVSRIKMSASTKNAVFEGLKSVTSEEGGTARAAFLGVPFIVAGKTGTSQYNLSSNAHGWFVGFAPYDNPQIAFAIVIENGGHGSYAAYVARDIIDTYFGLKQTNNKLVE